MVLYEARAAGGGEHSPLGGVGEGLVFTTATGQPIEPGNFVRSFERLRLRAGLRRIRVHDLRRTAATLSTSLVYQLATHS